MEKSQARAFQAKKEAAHQAARVKPREEDARRLEAEKQASVVFREPMIGEEGIRVATRAEADCQHDNMLEVLAAAAEKETVQLQCALPPEMKRPHQDFQIPLSVEQGSCEYMDLEGSVQKRSYSNIEAETENYTIAMTRALQDAKVLDYIMCHPKAEMFLDTLDLPNIIEYLFANESDFRLLMEDCPHQVWGLLDNEETVNFEKETQGNESVDEEVDSVPDEDDHSL